MQQSHSSKKCSFWVWYFRGKWELEIFSTTFKLFLYLSVGRPYHRSFTSFAMWPSSVWMRTHFRDSAVYLKGLFGGLSNHAHPTFARKPHHWKISIVSSDKWHGEGRVANCFDRRSRECGRSNSTRGRTDRCRNEHTRGQIDLCVLARDLHQRSQFGKIGSFSSQPHFLHFECRFFNSFYFIIMPVYYSFSELSSGAFANYCQRSSLYAYLSRFRPWTIATGWPRKASFCGQSHIPFVRTICTTQVLFYRPIGHQRTFNPTIRYVHELQLSNLIDS